MQKSGRPDPGRQPQAPGSRLQLAAIALFALLPLLFYGKYLFGDKMLFGTDWLGAGSYLWREFMASYIRSHGNVALWWPALLCGQPTAAGFFADMFYPTLLLRLVLPVHVVWTWTFVIHHFLAGLGTYLFLRELKLSVIPAALGGIAYEMAGSLVTLAYAGHDGRLIGSALMPLALFFLHRGMTRRQFVYFALTGLVLALQLLSGHVQKVYYTGLILFAYFLFMLIQGAALHRMTFWQFVLLSVPGVALVKLLFGHLDDSAKVIVRLRTYVVIAVGLGVALSAIQYLPVYGNMTYASRGGERGYEYAASWSMPVVETFDLVTPKFSGGLDAYWSSNPFKLHSEYLGILPLLFAFIAVLRRWKDRNVKFFTFSFAGALLMAWGGNTPFYYIPYYLFPGISKFRGPAMIFFLAAFSLVALAGLGLDYVLRELRDEESRKTVRTALVGAAIPVVLLLVFAALKGTMLSLLQAATMQSQQKLAALNANYPTLLGGLALAAAVAAVGFLLVRLLVGGRLNAVVFAGVMATVMIADVGLSLNLWNDQKGYIRGVDKPSQYFAPDEAIAFLKQDTSLYRVLPWFYERSDDGILAYNGIQSVAGQMPNPLQVYQDFLGAGSSVMFRPDNLLNPNYMNLANIKYVIAPTLPDDVSRYDAQTQQTIARIQAVLTQPQLERVSVGQKYSVYRNHAVLPRAFVAPGFQVTKNKEELLGTLSRSDFNPARTVLLYKDPGFVPGPDSVDGAAQVLKYDCNEVKVSASLVAPGLLVLTDTYVPDWRAYVDGKPAPVLQAFHTFRAVPLSAGQHEVVFKYESRWYRLGSYVSGAALLLLIGILAVSFIRRRKSIE